MTRKDCDLTDYAQTVSFIKNEKPDYVFHLAAQVYGIMGRRQNFIGQNFWARGYFVSTVGRDEKVIREYIRRQEQEDQRLEQLKLVTE